MSKAKIQSTNPDREHALASEQTVTQLRDILEQLTGERSKAPNKVFLARSITAAEAAKKAAKKAPKAKAIETPETEVEDKPTTHEGKRLCKMEIAELRAAYEQVVGRPTGSEHRRYLIWKITEAKKGKVPVGPRQTRSNPDADYKVLPVRLEAELVEQIDAARERVGLKSRMDLFRVALAEYFTNHGEADVAKALA